MAVGAPSYAVKLPFKIRQFSEQMLSKLNRNFEEIEMWLTRFQLYMSQSGYEAVQRVQQSADTWDRAANINADGTFPTEKLSDKWVGLQHTLQLVDEAVTSAKIAVGAIKTLHIEAGAITLPKTNFPHHYIY
jgi:hypothetical protein